MSNRSITGWTRGLAQGGAVAAALSAGYNSALSRLKGISKEYPHVAAKKPAKKAVKPAKKATSKAPVKKAAARPAAKPAPKKATPASKAAKKAPAKKAPAKKVAKAVVKKPAPKPVAKKAPARPAPAKRPATKPAAPVAKAPAKKPAPAAKPAPVAKKAVAKPAPAAARQAAPAPVQKTTARSASKPAASVQKPAAVVAPPAPRKPGKVAVAVVSNKSSAPAPRGKVKVVPYRVDEASGRPLVPAGYKPAADEEYMSPLQLEYFRQRLLGWRADLVEESKQTIENLKEEVRDVGDEAERATRETENSLELRTRDRYRKLIGKIDSTLKRLDAGDYGYCVDTGEEIGLDRLEARLTAERTIDAQERWEHSQKLMGD